MIICINRLKKDDIDDVVRIESAAYGCHHWTEDAFNTELNNTIASYYTAKDETGILLGYVGFWSILDEAHITTLAVNPKHLRKHVGEALLHKVLSDCYNKFIKYITLEVRVSNTPAISLYQKYQLKSLGTRKGYYQDNNEDALIMWTENIFNDSFKNIYNKNTQELKQRIEVKCQNE